MIFTARPCPQKNRPPRAGFALIITIILMSMMVLMMVSMAALTRVEIQIAANCQQADQARNNALLALNLAIGQLQAAAGPDQRITARADILDSTPTTEAITGVNQPHWTGVWKTGSASPDVTLSGLTPQRTTTFGTTSPTLAQKSAAATAWLVSRPTPTSVVDPIAGPTGATITLASQLGATPTDVKVPLVDLTATVPGLGVNQTIGRYGYWVADEGVKARVNLKDPTLKTDASGAVQVGAITNDANINTLAKNQLHFAAPQAMAAHKILPSTLATDFRQNPKVDQVLTPQQLPFLPASAPNGFVSNQHLPDITTYSYGVLADVRNGGLRKDLTAAFEDTGGTPNTNYARLNPNDTQRVYNIFNDTIPLATQTQTTGYNGTQTNTPRGLVWNSMFEFYNRYKSTQPTVLLTANTSPTVGQARPTGIGNPATRPYVLAPSLTRTYDTNVNPGFNAYGTGVLSPICIAMRWDVGLESKLVGGTYKLLLNYYPQSVWYNPYSVTINSTKQYQNITFSPVQNVYLKVSYTSGGSVINRYCMLNQSDIQRVSYNNTGAQAASFEPGAIRVFGLSSSPAIGWANVPDRCFAALNNIYYASSFGNKFSSPLVSLNYGASFHKSAEYTSVTNIVDLKSATVPYTPISGLPFGTQITISLGTIGNPATEEGPMATYRGPGWTAALTFENSYFWPTPIGDTRMTNGNLAAKTDTGKATPSFTARSQTFAIQQLTTPQLLLTVNTRKKGLRSFATATYSNSSFDVPSFMGNSDGFNPINPGLSSTWNEFAIPDFSTWPTNYSAPDAMQMANDGSYKMSTWGDQSAGEEFAAVGGSYRKVLADIPIQPMVSLGQFMHLQTSQKVYLNYYQQLEFGSMFVGGSYPNPGVPLNQTLLDVNNNTTGIQGGRFYSLDHSYLANQALFDSCYFSTVPPTPASLTGAGTGANPSENTPVAQVYPTNWVTINNNPANATQFTDTSTPFLNSRMVPYRKNGVAPKMDDLRDMDRAAGNLLLSGAFNINSTSVAAWRTLLSSLSGNDLSLWNASTKSAVTFRADIELKNPIPRFWSATGNASVNTPWCGVRSLDDTEVTELATRIVAEVKTRGPFLSLADFLNRRLASSPTDSTDLTRAGALQAAIDKTSPDINATIKASGVAVNVTAAVTGSANLPQPLPILTNMQDASNNADKTWNTTLGMPGYLMQQDLVQAFSPVMAARSDTFVVRTYGEKTDPLTGKSVAKAYCEAVVQRVPDYVDQNDGALTTTQTGFAAPAGDATPVSLVNITNQRFGRRFRIVFFRWITPYDL